MLRNEFGGNLYVQMAGAAGNVDLAKRQGFTKDDIEVALED